MPKTRAKSLLPSITPAKIENPKTDFACRIATSLQRLSQATNSTKSTQTFTHSSYKSSSTSPLEKKKIEKKMIKYDDKRTRGNGL